MKTSSMPAALGLPAGLLTLWLLGASPALAADTPNPREATEGVAPEAWRFSGFGTLGLTHNNNAEAGAVVSFEQKRPVRQGWSGNLDSVLGLQAEWQPLPDTSVQVQGVARAGEDAEPALRIAFVRQQLSPSLSLRLGRLRSPLFFDSDVAEIGYANLMARPSLSLYGIVNSVSGLDGGDLQWRHSLGDAALLVQLSGGSFAYKQHFYNLPSEAPAQARLTGIYGLAVSATLPDVTLRLSHTKADRYTLRSDAITQLNGGFAQLSGGLQMMASNPMLPAGAAAALNAQAGQIAGMNNLYDNRVSYSSLGFDANLAQWRVMGELVHMGTNSAMVGSYRGAGLTLGRAVGDFTPYVSVSKLQRYGQVFDTSALAATGMDASLDAGLGQMQAAMGLARQFADISSQSASVGARWDWREDMALKLQLDRVRSPNAKTGGTFAVTAMPFKNQVNLVTVALDLVF